MSAAIPRRGATVLVALAIGCAAARPAAAIEPAAPRSPANLVESPPRVESLTLQFVAATSRLNLEVAIAADPRLGPRVRIGPAAAPVELRDDGTHGDRRRGDGVYSGSMPIDPAELRRAAAAQRAAERRQAKTASRPVSLFDGREIARRVTPLRIDWWKLLHGIKARLTPIDCAYAQSVDWPRSLLVTDRAVVTDAARTYVPFAVDPTTGTKLPAAGTRNGVWSFEHLVRAAAGAADPNQVLRGWLETWAPPTPPAPTPTPTPLIVNGWPATARPGFANRIVAPWPRDANGGLDVGAAPFQLLAIVNRIDKADGLSWTPMLHDYDATKGSAGELRFVFGALAAETGAPLRFTVIFEYTVLQPDCTAFGHWARRWVDLSALPIGSDAYRTALAQLTEDVVSGGHGALARIRTNEVDLGPLFGGALWDMREFHPDGSGHLQLTTVENTPDACFNATLPLPAPLPPACVGGQARLATWVSGNPGPIASDHYTVPPQLPPPTPLLGAQALAKGALTYWELPGVNDDLRFHFSLGTCNGCHNRETATDSLHISPMVPSGQPARLSQFLTGVPPGMTPTPVTDPRSGAVRNFNDLERRRQTLSQAATLPCLCDLLRVTLLTPH
ncbi:MAG: choice-of-anchor X domain-containing protein [Deltaproteobacteria bacterium]|nr:choice-of-anchor X domain-containing protein [Deltaproteobacteria bacterium]